MWYGVLLGGDVGGLTHGGKARAKAFKNMCEGLREWWIEEGYYPREEKSKNGWSFIEAPESFTAHQLSIWRTTTCHGIDARTRWE